MESVETKHTSTDSRKQEILDKVTIPLSPLMEPIDFETVEIDAWEKGALKPTKKSIPVHIIVSKLEQAFSLGCNISEACTYAGISRMTYHRWTTDNSELKDRFIELQQNPILLAKQRAVSGIMESYGNAMDYLKRVRPMEFGDRNLNLNADLGDRMILLFSEDELKDVKEGKKKYVDGKVVMDETYKPNEESNNIPIHNDAN